MDKMKQRRSEMTRPAAHHWLPRTPSEWLRLTLVIICFALIAHFSIGAFARGIGFHSQQAQWVQLLCSLMYAAVITLSQIFSGEAAHRMVPLRSTWSAVAHIAIQSVSGVAAFAVVRQIELTTTGDCSIPDAMFIAVCSVTFVLSLIGNSGFYILYFQRRASAAQQAVLASELSALRAQINPHFLFNTLNSIAALIRINPEQAEVVTENLADLFRYSLRTSKTPMVNLEEELQSAELYARIEKARFGARLDIEFTVPEELRDASVPSLMLQPLVENAVKHACSVMQTTCQIRVRAQRRASNVVLRVEDNGPGFDLSSTESLFHRGTGLVNVRDRLNIMFNHECSMSFEAHAVVLSFPYTIASKRNPTESAAPIQRVL